MLLGAAVRVLGCRVWPLAWIALVSLFSWPGRLPDAGGRGGRGGKGAQ